MMSQKTIILQGLCLLALLLSSSSALADNNFYRYFYGLNYQMMKVNDINEGQALDMQVDDYAHSVGVYYRGDPWPYFQFAFGLDFIYIEDDNPFSERVRDTFTGKFSDRESDVTGKGAYFELGLQQELLNDKSLTLGMLVGYRYNDVSRSIFRCKDCEEETLNNFENSSYLKPFIEYQFTKSIHVQLYYNHYFNDVGFENGIGLRMSIFSL